VPIPKPPHRFSVGPGALGFFKILASPRASPQVLHSSWACHAHSFGPSSHSAVCLVLRHARRGGSRVQLTWDRPARARPAPRMHTYLRGAQVPGASHSPLPPPFAPVPHDDPLRPARSRRARARRTVRNRTKWHLHRHIRAVVQAGTLPWHALRATAAPAYASLRTARAVEQLLGGYTGGKRIFADLHRLRVRRYWIRAQ
jgi:hypothetical protein